MATSCVFDPENPLKACTGEGLRANMALRDYAFMGPGRSIRRLFEKYRQQSDRETTAKKNGIRQPGEISGSPPSTRLKTLMDWSSKYRWQERVAVWEAIQDAAVDLQWQERRREHREDEWELRSSLVDLARNVLAEGPKFLQTKRHVQKDGTEIITVALDARLAVDAAEMASKLGRLAGGMETDRKKIDHSGSLAVQPGGNMGELSDVELDQLIRNLSAAADGDAGAGAAGEAETPDEH